MKTVPLLASIAIAVIASSQAQAEETPSPDGLREITLDIDHDGKPDRATLTRMPGSADANLSIYFSTGTEAPDLSRTPALLRKNLVTGHVIGLESNRKDGLIVRYGCGGCSNDTETALTIVYRGGELWVAGFTHNWDTRDYGIGACDINYLTGKGVYSLGPNGKSRPINATFRPVKLADWSDEKRPKACN